MDRDQAATQALRILKALIEEFPALHSDGGDVDTSGADVVDWLCSTPLYYDLGDWLLKNSL